MIQLRGQRSDDDRSGRMPRSEGSVDITISKLQSELTMKVTRSLPALSGPGQTAGPTNLQGQKCRSAQFHLSSLPAGIISLFEVIDHSPF
jgi:hypothetical protein